jgi:hypothetical protein
LWHFATALDEKHNYFPGDRRQISRLSGILSDIRN